jgi:hypothetical protein
VRAELGGAVVAGSGEGAKVPSWVGEVMTVGVTEGSGISVDGGVAVGVTDAVGVADVD